mgnify:CR=1 FL=1
MKNKKDLSELSIWVRGAGDIASGVAWRLHQCGFGRIVMTEIPEPMAVRGSVAFCEAVYEGRTTVEGMSAVLVHNPAEVHAYWKQGVIPLMVDPEGKEVRGLQPDILLDAILAKKNLGTSLGDAPLVMALGPGFEAGKDVHYVVETNRGHYLGRLLTQGRAEANTGTPGPVQGITTDRVLRASANGRWETFSQIGDSIKAGDRVGAVDDTPVTAAIDGVIRGLIRPGIQVTQGLKIGDIDPRGIQQHCFSISEKALAIAGGVLEGILRHE